MITRLPCKDVDYIEAEHTKLDQLIEMFPSQNIEAVNILENFRHTANCSLLVDYEKGESILHSFGHSASYTGKKDDQLKTLITRFSV